MRSEVLTAVMMSMLVFKAVMSCGRLGTQAHQRFGGNILPPSSVSVDNYEYADDAELGCCVYAGQI